MPNSRILKRGTVLVPKPEWAHLYRPNKEFIITAEHEKQCCTIGEKWMIKTTKIKNMNHKSRKEAIAMIAARITNEQSKHQSNLPDDWAIIAAGKIMVELEECYIPVRIPAGNRIAIDALKKIASPITYLQQEAKNKGASIDGMAAIALSNDAAWLRQTAESALKNIETEYERLDNLK